MVICLELVVVAICVWLGISWLQDPSGPWEPLAFLFGLPLPAFDILRRLASSKRAIPSPHLLAPRAIKQRRELLLGLAKSAALLGPVVQDALKFARDIANKDLELWCRMEIDGYGGLPPDAVPEYRAATGRWVSGNEYLDLTRYNDLAISNECRLRHPIKSLDDLASRDCIQPIYDESRKAELAQLGLNVSHFEVGPTELKHVIYEIRGELQDRLNKAFAKT